MKMLTPQYIETLEASAWFAQLPNEAKKTFISRAKTIVLNDQQRVYSKNDVGDGFHCVLEGRICVSNLHSSGKQMVLAYLDKGSWFGEISMFDGLGRSHDTDAVGKTILAYISRQHFELLLKEYPIIYQYFTRLLCARLRTAFSFIDASASLTLYQRLAKRLILMASNFGQSLFGHNNVQLEVSQESLAMMINSSRQSVNQLLKEMERDGLVELAYGRIILLDVDGLKALCEWE